jgi:hypothetical protein
MSMSDLHLGFKLSFATTEDQEDSEDLLLRLMGLNARLNKMQLRNDPAIPKLYDSKILYTPPDQSDGRPPITSSQLRKLLALIRDMGRDEETALMVVRILKGVEIFLDVHGLLRRGKGDCNELVPWRIAELWRAGILPRRHISSKRRTLTAAEV